MKRFLIDLWCRLRNSLYWVSDKVLSPETKHSFQCLVDTLDAKAYHAYWGPESEWE